jgi:hypothetical protein
MTKIEIIPASLEHFATMTLRPEELDHLGVRYLERATPLFELGFGWTLFCDQKVICMGGFYEMWAGVYDMWLFPDVCVPQYSIIFLKNVRRVLGIIEDTNPVHRIQTSSIADEMHDKWMRFLGFSEEGYMKKYSPAGRDYKMWARIL